MKHAFYIAAVLGMNVVSAFCADQCNQFEIVLYAKVWQVTSFYVQDDIVLNPNRDFEVLEPEGLACKQGLLYASGDREEWSTSSRLAVYAYSGNLLTYMHYVQMPTASPDWWGPEGLAFNTSGDVNTFGAGLNELVSVESDVPPQAGIINLVSGAVTNKFTLPASQDITYIAARSEFALIADGSELAVVTIYDNQLASVLSTFSVTDSARGIASLTAGFAEWLTDKPVVTDAFIVTIASGGENKLAVYDRTGLPIGPLQSLPVSPKARIPFGGGVYMIEPAFSQIEAVAIDQHTQTLFIADYGNAMIHILRPIRLASDIDADGTVDLTDLLLLANRWLASDCSHPAWCDGADIQHDQNVNNLDLAMMAAAFARSYEDN